MNEPRESQVSDLIAHCLEQASLGQGERALDEVRASHPDLVEDVAAGLQVAERLPAFSRTQVDDVSAVGKVLGDRYTVTRRIGAGAMGIVYEADDLELGRKVAMKVLRTGLFERFEALERFEREATALASIDHESVVRIHDRGATDEGSPILVMEYVDGVSCADLLDYAEVHGLEGDGTAWLKTHFDLSAVREESFLRLVIQWAASLAGGLAACHAAGVFHRDVKPSNIMIRRDGRAVLLDFGISVREDHATLTQTGAAMGTPAYMAPEAAFGKVKAQGSLDVYGLTATLYHLLTLQAPYHGNPTEILAALATREPLPAGRLRPNLPRDIQGVLEHGMDRRVASRYPTAHALEDDLRAFLAYRPLSVRRTTALTRGWRKARRSRLVQGAALAVAALGMVWLVMLWQERGAAERAERFAAPGAYPAIPPNLGVVSGPNRVFQDEELRAQVEATLDTVVGTGHAVVTSRLLRGLFRWDHGEYQLATVDLNAMARAAGTDYAEALARRYADAARSPETAEDGLSLEDLPACESDADRYLAAVHAVRGKDFPRAVQLLEASDLTSFRHGQEILMLMGLNAPMKMRREATPDDDAIYGISEALAQRIIRLEEADGYRSAMTLSLLGTLRLLQHRYADALAVCEAGLKLSPPSFVLRINAAAAAEEQGLYGTSAEHAREGLRIRPGFHKLQISVYKGEAHAGNFDAARRAIESSHWEDSGATLSDKVYALAWTSLEEAIMLMESNPERSKAAASEAIEIVAGLRDGAALRARVEARASAVLEGDRRSLRLVFFRELLEQPTSLSRLAAIREAWPDVMDEEELTALGAWFDQLYLELSRPTRVNSSIKR